MRSITTIYILNRLKMILVMVLLFIGVNYASAIWNAAPANPPNNNVAAPINASSYAQIKSGNLGVRGLTSFGTGVIGDTPPANWQNGGFALWIGGTGSGKVLANDFCMSNTSPTKCLSNSGGFSGVVSFDTSTTWTPPAGVSRIMVRAWGGGGGGADKFGDTGSGCSSSGGGGGEYAESVLSVSSASTYQITVGTGGLRGATQGANGGATAFSNGSSDLVRANGGAGASGATGGAGGSGGIGLYEINGGRGGDSIATSYFGAQSIIITSGIGGLSSGFGRARLGQDGTIPGGGGGGGQVTYTCGVTKSAGNGGNGRITIYW